jgi:hypothetical protein
MEYIEFTDLAWKVGRGHISAKDLVLVLLAQVSKGPRQPFLRLPTYNVSREQSMFSFRGFPHNAEDLLLTFYFVRVRGHYIGMA